MKPDLHWQARMERYIYGEVVSESLKGMPPPNPAFSKTKEEQRRRDEQDAILPLFARRPE